MGEPVRIVDLARQLIRLAGHREDEIPIVYSGLRPGEKLYEEMLADADTTLPTSIERLRIARLREHEDEREIARWLEEAAAAGQPGDEAVRALLRRLVPEFANPGSAA